MVAIELSSAVAWDPITETYYVAETGETIEDQAAGRALAQSEVARGMIVLGVNDEDTLGAHQVPEVSVSTQGPSIWPWVFLAVFAAPDSRRPTGDRSPIFVRNERAYF